MHEHGQHAQFKHPLRQARFLPQAVAAAQEVGHAENPLQGVLQVVVMRVNGLVIP